MVTDFRNPSDIGVLCPQGRKDCSEDDAQYIAIQPDGRIVVAGGAGLCNPTCSFAMSRYLGDLVVSAIPFSKFYTNLNIEAERYHTKVSLQSIFKLGAKSNGINPLIEGVMLKVGKFSTD